MAKVTNPLITYHVRVCVCGRKEKEEEEAAAAASSLMIEPISLQLLD